MTFAGTLSFHDTQFAGLDLPSNPEATRRAAEAALDLYAAPGSGDSWALGNLAARACPAASRPRSTEGCYELLLILAEAEPTPEAGPAPAGPGGPLAPPHRGLPPAAGGLPGGPAEVRRPNEERGRGGTSQADHGLRSFLDRSRAVQARVTSARPSGTSIDALSSSEPTTSGPNACRPSCCLQLGSPRRPSGPDRLPAA